MAETFVSIKKVIFKDRISLESEKINFLTKIPRYIVKHQKIINVKLLDLLFSVSNLYKNSSNK